MEIEETVVMEVRTKVMTLARNMASKNMVSIFEHNLIYDYTQDESGTVPETGGRYIRLEPHGFTPSHLSELLRGQQVNESQHIGQIVASKINLSLTDDKSIGEPLSVNVHVYFIKERRLIVPSDAPASFEFLQRLVEEHRVDSKGDQNEAPCSICTEDVSQSHESIIELPQCLHMFHQNCLFEWLCRKNSCPLCRRVPRIKKQRLQIVEL